MVSVAAPPTAARLVTRVLQGASDALKHVRDPGGAPRAAAAAADASSALSSPSRTYAL